MTKDKITNLTPKERLDKIHDSTEKETQDNFQKVIREIGVGIYKPHGEWVSLWKVRSELSKMIAEIVNELYKIQNKINKFGDKK